MSPTIIDGDDAAQTVSPISSGTKLGAPVKNKPVGNKSKRREPIQWRHVRRLIHRFFVFAAAWRCIFVSFASVSQSVKLLRSSTNPSYDGGAINYPMAMRYAGSRSLRDSPLVMMALGNTTQPRDNSIYLSATSFSTESCVLFGSQAIIMGNSFLRSVYTEIVDDTSYSLHQLGNMELIAPIVDCTSVDYTGDSGAAGVRLNFLVREKTNHDLVSMLIITLSNQQYSIPAQAEAGPAGVATMQIFSDMRETNLTTYFLVSIGYPMEPMSFRVYTYLDQSKDGQWILRNIPASSGELPKVLYTSFREGVYLRDPSQQSNINNVLWRLPTKPVEAISEWHFICTPVLRDTWAWVHLIHVFIGARVLLNQLVLCVATYRNFRAGKLWIGDAFVALSSSQLVNAIAVLISWYADEFWSLYEYCYNAGYTLLDLPPRMTYEDIMRADLLTLFLGAGGIIGSISRERIHPFLVVVCFHISYGVRAKIMGKIPILRTEVQKAGRNIYLRNVFPRLEGQDAVSPMLTRGEHPFEEKHVGFVVACLVPTFVTLMVIINYVIIRKIRRLLHPEKVRVQRNTTGTARSENEDAFLAQKRVLTLFEIATGAELENRFGLVCDYETCIFIKGMKFASADGIYSNGFVIANKKYLVSADDVWTIIAMKMLRKRFSNVYVYEVNGSTVKPTARLVYPHTLTLTDLMNLNVSILS